MGERDTRAGENEWKLTFFLRLLTYVETEGCQDGRDGRERGVDEHAPLVLAIHIHDFFAFFGWL